MTLVGSPIVPSVSVAVLNHRRPHLLARVSRAILQLDYPSFELVVVGDQASIQDFDLPSDIRDSIRYATVIEPNICMARNAAIRMAGGEVVAFIDDDAVPEPNWLKELVRPFAIDEMGAVAGSVRGGDGLKFEWSGCHFDRAASEKPLSQVPGIQIADAETQIESGLFLGMMGVNTAYRRVALAQVGGYDEAYRYYLDETDLALRLAEAGWSAAYAPAAEVHHMREQNDSRDALRVPRNLFQIAASKAYFCKRHLPEAELDAALSRFKRNREADLDPYIRLGALRGCGREALMAQIDEGLAEGLQRTTELPLKPAMKWPDYVPLEHDRDALSLNIAVVSGWGIGGILRMQRIARDLNTYGHMVSAINFYTGPQPRTVRYTDGVWMHTGGTWRADQRSAGKRVIGRRARALAEIKRVSRNRQFDAILTPYAVDGARKIFLQDQARPVYVAAARPNRLSVDAIAEILASAEIGQRHELRQDSNTNPSTVRRNPVGSPSIGYT